MIVGIPSKQNYDFFEFWFQGQQSWQDPEDTFRNSHWGWALMELTKAYPHSVKRRKKHYAQKFSLHNKLFPPGIDFWGKLVIHVASRLWKDFIHVIVNNQELHSTFVIEFAQNALPNLIKLQMENDLRYTNFMLKNTYRTD